MSPLARNALVAATVVLVAGAGWALFSIKAAGESAAAEAALANKTAAADAASARNQAQASDTHRRAVELAAEPKPAAKPAAARPPGPDFSAVLAAHPELQRDFEHAFAADKARDYGPLYRKLHLTQDQIDRLDLLLAKDFENSLDVDATAQAQGLARNDPSIAQMRKAQAADLQSQQQAILGPENYRALQVYDAEAPLRTRIGDASSLAVMSGNAMNGDQMQQLAELLAQTSPGFQKNPTARIDPDTVDWDAVLSQAQGFLTPAQLAYLHAEAQFKPVGEMQKQFYASRAKE